MVRQIEVMMIGQPSRFRDGIVLLLTSITEIERIDLAGDIESVIEKDKAPAIVVLDAAAGHGQLSASIKEIRIAWPLAGVIILVEDEQEFQAVATSGAAVALRKGFPAAKFIEAVESLLSA